MRKECWQLRNPGGQTPCFKSSGSTPCSAPDCAVEQKIEEFKPKGEEVSGWEGRIMPHFDCRVSFSSIENQEFLERIGKAGLLKYIRARLKIIAIRRALQR